MKLCLKNIGIIAEANIKLKGLTVITGKNNSGKTTVGRTLYALISAVENLQRDSLHDKWAYIRNALANPVDGFYAIGLSRLLELDMPLLQEPSAATLQDLLTSIDRAIETIPSIDMDEFSKYYSKMGLPEPLIKDAFEAFKKNKPSLIGKLKDFKLLLQTDIEHLNYASKKIEKKLDAIFHGQILPVMAQNKQAAECVFSADDAKFFQILINTENRKGTYKFSRSPFANAFFVDDSSVIDDLSDRRERVKWMREARISWSDDSFLDSLRVNNYQDDLLDRLLENPSTITDEIVIDKKIEPVIDSINKVIGYNIEWENGRFVTSDYKIDLRNLAQGSKMFLIIKTLLKNGLLQEKSLLILDEPENHLHPEWQKVLAEILILLVKNLGCHIILTTHSPDFVIALDVAANTHELVDKTIFYIANRQKPGLVDFDEVGVENGPTMNEVYLHLSKSFMELEERREELMLAFTESS